MINQPPPAGAAGDFLRSMLQAAEASIAEPYLGIVSGGALRQGLFPLSTPGASTETIRRAAGAYLETLTPDQRAEALFDVDTDKWRRWSNIHRAVMRHGLQLGRLSVVQRARAFDLLRASLSQAGFETARGIMRLNETLAELTGKPDEYGEAYYWLSIMGQPSASEPWGWQIDGHHLIINCFILGDHIVMTPTFMGSEVVFAEAGRYAGTRVLAGEEQLGLGFIRSLDAGQRARAILSAELPREVFTTAFRDNLELGFQGIRFADLSTAQQALARDLIRAYTGRMSEGHARVKDEEIERHLGETYLAWMGGTDDDSVFYYRVHSPVVLIEFDHQRGVALPTDQPTKVHVHTVVRTPNGNDYGKDLLRQHHQRFDHSHPNGAHTH